MLKVVLGIGLMGLISVVLKIREEWVDNRIFNKELLVVGVFFSVFIIFFGNTYLGKREVDTNISAVYEHFGKNNVTSITFNSDGDLKQAEVDDIIYEIKVSDGIVERAQRINK
jgi:hypothetical protein